MFKSASFDVIANICRVLSVLSIIAGLFLFTYSVSQAANILTYSDLLSSSVPGAYSNHTIQFTPSVDIPAGGFIRITPQDGEFNIVATTTLDVQNVELRVNGSPRAATGTADAANDGVAITYGTSGNVLVTLNSTTGITANDVVQVRLGNHTTQASSTLTAGIQNPSATGTKSGSTSIVGVRLMPDSDEPSLPMTENVVLNVEDWVPAVSTAYTPKVWVPRATSSTSSEKVPLLATSVESL